MDPEEEERRRRALEAMRRGERRVTQEGQLALPMGGTADPRTIPRSMPAGNLPPADMEFPSPPPRPVPVDPRVQGMVIVDNDPRSGATPNRAVDRLVTGTAGQQRTPPVIADPRLEGFAVVDENPRDRSPRRAVDRLLTGTDEQRATPPRIRDPRPADTAAAPRRSDSGGVSHVEVEPAKVRDTIEAAVLGTLPPGTTLSRWLPDGRFVPLGPGDLALFLRDGLPAHENLVITRGAN